MKGKGEKYEGGVAEALCVHSGWDRKGDNQREGELRKPRSRPAVTLLPSTGSAERNYFPLGLEREKGLQQPELGVRNKHNSNNFAWSLRLLTDFYYTLIGKIFPGHVNIALSIYFICNTEQTAMDLKEHDTP